MKIWNFLIILLCFQNNLLDARTSVFFRPRDDLKTQLIELIAHEKVSIDAAVYMLSDKAIADELVKAYVRGVKVRIVVDQISMGEKYGKGKYLLDKGVNLVAHCPKAGGFFTPIMHHKFLIFGRDPNRSLVWTGSYNFSASASKLHDENVIVTDDDEVIQQFRICFDMLWQRLAKRSVLEDDMPDVEQLNQC